MAILNCAIIDFIESKLLVITLMTPSVVQSYKITKYKHQYHALYHTQ